MREREGGRGDKRKKNLEEVDRLREIEILEKKKKK